MKVTSRVDAHAPTFNEAPVRRTKHAVTMRKGLLATDGASHIKFLLGLASYVVLCSGLPAFGQSPNQQVEPKAGTWKTWAISSGRDFRVPPPDAGATAGDLAWLKDFTQQKDPRIAEQVRFWNAGPPAYQIRTATSSCTSPGTRSGSGPS